MNIYVEKETEQSFIENFEDIIHEVVIASLDYVNCPYECMLDVMLVDNEHIHQLNLEHRGVDHPTDVLSFPFVDFEVPGVFDACEQHPENYFDAETGELMLGDIVVSVEKVYEQAEAYGHSPIRELAFLIAHSMLHLCGYDHEEESERIEMERMQEEILSSKGYIRD